MRCSSAYASSARRHRLPPAWVAEEQSERSTADRDHGALFARKMPPRKACPAWTNRSAAPRPTSRSVSARTWQRRAIELQKRSAAEKDPLVRQDLEILIAQADRDIRSLGSPRAQSASLRRRRRRPSSLASRVCWTIRSPPIAVLPRWFACASTPASRLAMSRSPCRPKNVFARS